MNNCFIFVEGYYDYVFLENILIPFLMESKQINVIPIPYQQKNKNKINKKIKASSFQDYFFLTDLDSQVYPCISSRKEKRLHEYDNLDFSKIIIVKEEIESWYLAGIDTSLTQFNKWDIPQSTDDITKEDFDGMLEENLIDSKIDFIKELSKNYNFDLAVKRNNSFKYFLDRLM